MFDPQVNIVGNNKGVQSTIERLASKAKRMQENYLSDDIMDAVLQKIRKLGEPTNTHFNTKNTGKEMKDRIKILEKLVKVDANKVVNKVGEEAMSIVHQIHSELQNLLSSEHMKMAMELASQKSNVTFSFSNQFTSITDGFGDLATLLRLAKTGIGLLCLGCNIFPDIFPNGCSNIEPFLELLCGEGLTNFFDELIRLLDCFGNYTEQDFEDGTEWLSCIYTCRYNFMSINFCCLAICA